MPQFAYKARRRTGETVQGVLDVVDRTAALTQIERLGLFPIVVDAAKGGAAAGRNAGDTAGLTDRLPTAARTFLKRKRKPKLQELATFTQQMANLLNSGMPLAVALNSMTHLESKGIPSEVTKDLKQEVMEGRSLSDAMARQPRIFSDLYVNMVRAGEQSGSLVDVLRRMAAHFHQFAEVQGKFTTAMIYPAMVCLVGVGLGLFFIYVMLPQFITMFQGFNVELPLPTKILIGVGNVFTNVWGIVTVLFVMVGLVIVFKRFKATPEGRRKLDTWKMGVPIFGKVVKLNLFAQFSRTLATLLHNGVPVLTSLQITEQVIPNVLLKEAIAKTRAAVTDGKTLAQPLASSKLFPQLLVDLVKIGEETGDVPGALANLADTYEGELQISLRIMTTLIEPLLIMVMAVGVGFLLLSVLLPMFKLISSINRG